jgi:hypothetical protein
MRLQNSPKNVRSVKTRKTTGDQNGHTSKRTGKLFPLWENLNQGNWFEIAKVTNFLQRSAEKSGGRSGFSISQDYVNKTKDTKRRISMILQNLPGKIKGNWADTVNRVARRRNFIKDLKMEELLAIDESETWKVNYFKLTKQGECKQLQKVQNLVDLEFTREIWTFQLLGNVQTWLHRGVISQKVRISAAELGKAISKGSEEEAKHMLTLGSRSGIKQEPKARSEEGPNQAGPTNLLFGSGWPGSSAAGGEVVVTNEKHANLVHKVGQQLVQLVNAQDSGIPGWQEPTWRNTTVPWVIQL